MGGTTLPTNDCTFVYGREDEIIRCTWHGWEPDASVGIAPPNHVIIAATRWK